jgi:Actinobacteria/chloroflexi VLRF1 release factor
MAPAEPKDHEPQLRLDRGPWAVGRCRYCGPMAERRAAGGGRWVDVPGDRVGRWFAGFADRHGGLATVESDSLVVVFGAADGTVAECHPPFPPVPDARGAPAEAVAALVAHAARQRVVGVLLVRLGGHAAGVFEGDRLVASKVGSRLVHGRSAAGGQSQQRFARRREKQVREAGQEAADVAARILLPYVPERADPALAALICGGDRRAVDPLRSDPRLKPLFALEEPPFLTVPDPRLAVLKATPAMFRAVRIRILDHPNKSGGGAGAGRSR